jgi:hypothetical protein
MEVNRLNCDVIGSRLVITIAGELCSGDLINFSYRAMQHVEKLGKGDTVLVDACGAKLNLIDGLWQKISMQFNERAQAKGVGKIAYVLPSFLFMKCAECAAPACVRIFENQPDVAEAWLNDKVAFAQEY